MHAQKQLTVIDEQPEQDSGLVEVSHRGTVILRPPLRISSQFIRDYTVGMLNYEDHVLSIHGETPTQNSLFTADSIRDLLDLKTMTVRELKVYMAIIERQGYEDKALYKSLNDLCKQAGMDRKTSEVKSILETLQTNSIYIADTHRKTKKPKWTKAKFIESIDTERGKAFKNIYHHRDKSKLETSLKEFLHYLTMFQTKQHEQASRFYNMVLQRITEKRNSSFHVLKIAELESRVFFRSVINRYDYKGLLKMCLEAFIELNFIDSYNILPDKKTILLNICGSPNTRKSSPNTRKSSPNTRKSSPNTRRPSSGDPDFIG